MLRLQRSCTQRACDRVVDRQQPALGQATGRVVAGGGGLIPDLAQRRRAHVVGHGAAQRKCRRELVARRQLAGDLPAEVAVVLVTRGRVGAQPVGQVAGQAGIDAGDLAAEVGFITGGQATAGLGTGRPVGVGPSGVGRGVARAGAVALVTELQPGGEGVLAEHAAQIKVAQGLLEPVVSGLEAGGAGGTERRVQRVGQAKAEIVDAVVETGVIVPVAPLTAYAGDRREIAVLAFGDRTVAIRVDLAPVVAAIGIAEVVRTFRVALVVGAEQIRGGGLAQRQLAVEPQVQVTRCAIAQHIVAPANGGEVGRRLLLEEGQLIKAGAIGGFAVLELEAHAGKPALRADAGADLAGEEAGLAVGDGAIDRLDIRVMGAKARLPLPALGRVIEDHVDDAGNRVRSVERPGAVAQHFDALDRADRDRVEVHRRSAATDLGARVDQRAVVAPLAVDQHQHLIGAEATQLRGTHVVGAAGIGLARKVE